MAMTGCLVNGGLCRGPGDRSFGRRQASSWTPLVRSGGAQDDIRVGEEEEDG